MTGNIQISGQVGISGNVSMGSPAAEVNNAAVNFDGTNDFLNRGADFTGNANGQKGIFSGWFKFNSGSDGADRTVAHSENGEFAIVRTAANLWNVVGVSDVPALALAIATTSTWAVADGWHHVLASWDLSLTTGKIYINDVDDTGATTFLNQTIAYQESFLAVANPDWNIMSANDTTTKMSADVFDIYLNIAEYLDFTVESNRRKFIDALGKSVDLGADGSTPTGTAPIGFWQGPAAGFETNLGSGGGMILTGTLTDSTTGPND